MPNELWDEIIEFPNFNGYNILRALMDVTTCIFMA